MMQVKHLNKAYGNKQVLKDVSVEFPAGQTTVLIGPSGSGKSTILRSLNLLVTPDNGTFDFNDHHVDFSQPISRKEMLGIRKDTGMVFQEYNLFPNKTVLGNVIEGPTQVLKQDKATAIKNAHEWLKKVGLDDKANAYPNELSGGQAQRVAIARAMAMEPEYLLLDEPTSALDPELELSVLKVLLALAKEKQSMVIVTHNMMFAQKVADKIVFVEDGEIRYDGDAKAFFDRENQTPRMRQFIDSITMADL